MTGRHALARLLERKKKEADRVFTPEEAILSGRFASYAARRLLAFGLARSIAVAFHIVELTVLAEIFQARPFVAALAMQNVMLVLDSLFWGALEGARREVRALGPGAEAATVITRWLGAALRAGAVVVLAPIVYVLSSLSRGMKTHPILVAYAIVCALRVAIDAVLRTYYSGVFAHRRVHRPVWSAFVGPSILVGVTLLAWDDLAGWSFPLALLLSTLASRTLLFVFTRRAYVRHRILPPSLRLALRRPRLSPSTLRVAALSGFANVTTRIGGVVLLAAVIPSMLVLDFDEGGGLEPFALSLHLAAPLLFLASQWSFVFYHDHKRLEADEAAALGRHLQRRLLATAVVVGVVAWALTAVLVLLYVPWRESRDVLAALFPATIGLSVWTAEQLRGFSRGEFAKQAAAAAAMVFVVAAVVSGVPSDGDTWYPALAVGPWVAVVAYEMLERLRTRSAWGELATFEGWSRARRAENATVWRAHVAERPTRVAARIAEVLGPRGALVRTGARILWFERGAPSSRADWLRIGAGELVDLERDPEIDASETPPFAALRDLHDRLFPSGFVVRVGRRPPRRFLELPAFVRQAIWKDAVRALRGKRPRSGFRVTPFAPAGHVEALFVAPKPIDPAKAEAWRAAGAVRSAPTSPRKGEMSGDARYRRIRA